MKISCLLIDDEPLARQGLKEYIQDIDFLHLLGEFDNPLPSAALLSEGRVQLLFLDIEMPRITGVDFFKSLAHPPPVIFTTAYPQYALEGFNLQALDYLVKPISFDRFLKAALRAREFYELRQQNSPPETAEPGFHFFIKSGNTLVRIDFDDILFIEALQNYVLIHTTEKKHITYLTFHSVEEYLPSRLFIKTHKSYIVSASKVGSIEGNEILIGHHRIPISRNLKEEVMEKLLGNRFLRR